MICTSPLPPFSFLHAPSFSPSLSLILSFSYLHPPSSPFVAPPLFPLPLASLRLPSRGLGDVIQVEARRVVGKILVLREVMTMRFALIVFFLIALYLVSFIIAWVAFVIGRDG